MVIRLEFLMVGWWWESECLYSLGHVFSDTVIHLFIEDIDEFISHR